MKKTIVAVAIFSTLVFSGCMRILQSVIGIKDPKPLSDQQIVKSSRKFRIDQAANYRIDTSYFDYIYKLDTAQFKAQRKNHLQPLQALYFNASGTLEKFYINCYAGGFPNLNWNRDGMLNVFPPKDQAPLDTVLDLRKQLHFLRPVTTATKAQAEDGSEYYVVVYWNKCTKRHSKRLIKSIQSNITKANTGKIKLIYANYDGVFEKLERKKSTPSN